MYTNKKDTYKLELVAPIVEIKTGQQKRRERRKIQRKLTKHS